MVDNVELVDCNDAFRIAVVKQLNRNKRAVIFEIIFLRTFDLQRIKLKQRDPICDKVHVFFEALNLSNAHT